MLNRLAMQIIGIGLAALIMGGLFFYARTAAAQRDLARANYQQAISANQSLQDSMRQLQAEKVLADEMRAELAQELEQIRRTTRATIDRQAREIAQLRRDYETVAEYHSAVAPDEHILWVCEQLGSCPD